MDKRLKAILMKQRLKEGYQIIDTYNQVIITDIACTITTRVNESNCIYLAEVKENKNEPKENQD